MTRIGVKLLTVMSAISMTVGAATQIATITSDGPFQLRGASIATGQGVPSWPAIPNDIIQVGQTPLTVTFLDGSTTILSPGAKAKLDLSDKTPVLLVRLRAPLLCPSY